MSVYFIQAGEDGPIKIGHTSNVPSRLKSLQTGHAAKLKVLGQCEGDKKLEKSLHHKFAEHRLTGEWFNPVQEILAEIAERCAPVPSQESTARENLLDMDFETFKARMRAIFSDDPRVMCAYLREKLPASTFDKIMAATAKSLILGSEVKL